MIQALRGTKDILPEQSFFWQYLENAFRKSSDIFGFAELRTPIFEKTEVFARSIGDETDIVKKEMYTFEDRSGDSITLRPEGTAALVRAVIQNGLLNEGQINKLWYFGPFFRHERPQKGRMRQFYQYGAELLGSESPKADIELILLANQIFSTLNMSDYKLIINTLGTEEVRVKYINSLTKFLQDVKEKLSEDSKSRLERNPLRILDSKDKSDQDILKQAPSILEFLDDISKKHFDFVCDSLEKGGIKFEISNNLVRGLDYYCHTVFEFQSSELGSQDAFGGGGRYDGLFQQLGAKKQVPAIGFALGVERLLMILGSQNKLPEIKVNPDVYVVTVDNANYLFVLQLVKDLRKMGLQVLYDVKDKSVKAQFREANKLNSKYTIVIGEEEQKTNILTVKNMYSGETKEYDIKDIGNIIFDF